MEKINNCFWEASLDAVKKGYETNSSNDIFICLFCGKQFEKGVVYPEDGKFFDAEKFMLRHIESVHGSVFETLLEMDKKYTGLTDLQKKLIELFGKGISDQDILKEIDGNSASTIRNHRFSLREREKQAKIFLAIMELMKEKKNETPKFVPVHPTATMVDDRFSITEEETVKILGTYFKEGADGPLSEFPVKEKRKIIILRHIVTKFDTDKKYSEKEVNSIIKNIWDDFVTIRRYLIEYGFMDRTPDGSQYWVKK